MKPKNPIFGTDGVRGEVGKSPVTVESFLALGQAIGYYFASRKPSRHIRHKIVIGKDTRRSNYMLEQAVSAGICAAGVDSMLLGPIPTPGISFITTSMRADAGIVISASHNPYIFNGLKVFDDSGIKIRPEQESEISYLYEKFLENSVEQRPSHVGKCKRLDDVFGRYIVHLKHFFPLDLSVEGYRVILDCANGATYKVAPIIFDELGCDLICTGVNPDGQNINDGVGSTHMAHIRSMILADQHCDAGFAFDGDGDRCLMVSRQGHILDGDKITAMIAYYYRDHLKLSPFTIVLTEMSNTGLLKYLASLNCPVHVVPVGDRNVHMGMQSQKALIGSEPSGHIIFGNQFNTGDGILTAINILRVLVDTQKGADVLYHLYNEFPATEINVKVEQKPPLHSLPKTHKRIEEIRKTLGTNGKLVVRYSGTESIARIKVEGPSEDKNKQMAETLAESIHQEVNLPLLKKKAAG
jgi:phosphoglucosamine mutase